MKRLAYAGTALVVLAVIVVLAAPSLVESTRNRVRNPGPYRVSLRAEQLHRTLVVADLHCDSLLWGRDLLKRSTTGHVDLPRLLEANVAVQAFTVVTQVPMRQRSANSPDLIGALAMLDRWPHATWNSPKQRALYQAEQLHRFAAGSDGRLVLVKRRADLQRALEQRSPGGRVAVFLGAEGTQPLEGKLENLDALYAAGFRMMAPTHFSDTAVGGASSGDGNAGLSALGREWVRRMEASSVLIDLAHASVATLRDVTAMATKPLVISHTGVTAVCNNSRNVSDEQLRAVARTGDVVGIGYWQTATCGQDVAAIARAIRHAVSVIGVEHVALGSDFDGAVTMPFDVTGLPLITEALLREGFTEEHVRLIMGGNTVRVLLQTLPE